MNAVNKEEQPSHPTIVRSVGDVLGDGAILEPILSCVSSEPLKLAFWNGSQTTIAPRIELGRVIYEPAPPDPSGEIN